MVLIPTFIYGYWTALSKNIPYFSTGYMIIFNPFLNLFSLFKYSNSFLTTGIHLLTLLICVYLFIWVTKLVLQSRWVSSNKETASSQTDQSSQPTPSPRLYHRKLAGWEYTVLTGCYETNLWLLAINAAVGHHLPWSNLSTLHHNSHSCQN